jgi:CBS domain containing-hemolysin-like protein
MGLEELNDALEWELPKRNYETVSGLILSVLGRIPRPGEVVSVDGYELSVVDADERRILKVKVRATTTGRPASAAKPSSPPLTH